MSKSQTIPCILLVPISIFTSVIICKIPTFFFFIPPSFLLFFLLFFPSHTPFVSFSFLSLPLFLITLSPLNLFLLCKYTQVPPWYLVLSEDLQREFSQSLWGVGHGQPLFRWLVYHSNLGDFVQVIWWECSHCRFLQSLAGNSAGIYSPIHAQGYRKGKRKPKSWTMIGFRCEITTGLLRSYKGFWGICEFSVYLENCRI